MPWNDPFYVIAAGAVGTVAAEVAFRLGRSSYRTVVLWCAVYILISLGQAAASDIPPDVDFLLYTVLGLAFAWGAYFLALGLFVTFRAPKRVKCLRCEWVGYPWETDEPATVCSEEERKRFRHLHYECRLTR